MLSLIVSFFLYQTPAFPQFLKQGWSSESDPLTMSSTYETRFWALPAEAKVNSKDKFWSGDYWALNRGSIDLRWHAKGDMINMPPPSKMEALKLSQEVLSQLSPAEKFDLLNDLYHYPLKKQVMETSDLNAKDWEGLCHGWAPASMNHNQPTPKILKNPSGISIPFGSSDIKALLSYFYANHYQVENTYQIGRRCQGRMGSRNQNCKQDLNAGAFHIIVANRIGVDNQGVIADMDRWSQVWNHPIMGFKTKVIKEKRGRDRNSAMGTVRILHLKTTLYFVDEDRNAWELTPPKILSKGLEYSLELNAQGMVIGGEWKNLIRPDFLWIKQKPQKFSGMYYRLSELLND